MDTNEMLKGYDMDNFMEYCRQFNSAENNKFCDDADYLLRFWREAKSEYLYDLMGQELILSKRFTYERDNSELFDSLEKMVYQHRLFYDRFHEQLRTALGANPDSRGWDYNWPNEDNKNFFYAVCDWGAPDSLIDNRVGKKVQATINGKLIKISSGEKIMRALRKICQALAAAGYPDLNADLEELRLDHSRIFNQKTVSGELCLSIHPLDYATASDNDNGWSSCMSWQEEGCYRLGTVEMMNSPMVICAYLKSDVQQMRFNGYEWPSKKWRAWIVVNKDAILCNRNYPYTNDNLAKECINWVAELAKENLGWEFTEEIKPASDWYDDEHQIKLIYETNFMYNDFRDDMWLAVNKNLKHGSHYINYSGIANCMNCGEEIPWEGEQDSSTLCCLSCRNVQYCSECGEPISDEYYYGPNDELLCCDCYSRLVTHCEVCDTDLYAEDSIYVYVPINSKLFSELTNHAEWCAPHCEQNLCPDCAKDLGITEENLLTIDDITFPSNWNISRWGVENILDPRKVPITTFYKLLGYRLDKDNKPIFDWMQQEIDDLHIDELWEDYRRYVTEVLGEAD